MGPARVLVVCTANIARSPLAEVLLRGHARKRGVHDDVLVASAGTRARDGYPAADSSAKIASQWGLDLSSHRSRAVTPEMLDAADLVITMSERQRDHLSGRTHGLYARCFTVKELTRLLEEIDADRLVDDASARVRHAVDEAQRRRPVSLPPSDGENVADPFGGPHEGFITMANELVELHSRFVPILLGGKTPAPGRSG